MTTTTLILKTRSGAPYALVAKRYAKPVYEGGVYTPGEFLGAEIVGYAHSTKHSVELRAARLRALVLPIVGGKVEVEV